MTTGREEFDHGGRPGVRANALPARAFTRARTVDARVSEAVLDVLEDAGVAAYVEPSLGEIGAYRDVRAYRAPTDDLYVDTDQRDVAAAVLAAELPGMLAELDPDETSEDDAFAAIVAGFDAPVAETASWPATENATATATDSTEHDDAWYAAHPVASPSDEDEHFVPPPPPPLPRLSGGKLWGVVLLVGGFVLMAALPKLGFDPQDSMIIGILTTAVGAGTLVWWMRDDPRDYDPDDGAVV